MQGDDIFVAGPRLAVSKMGATLEKKWKTRDPMIGPKLDDQKELRIVNRTLRWSEDGKFEAYGREVVDEMGLSKSKPVSSPGKRNVYISGLWQSSTIWRMIDWT